MRTAPGPLYLLRSLQDHGRRGRGGTSRPVALDLFCSAGGAGMGYYLAGFDVVGVDIEPQKRYPFRFIQADALTFPLSGFDLIHASPVCKGYSATAVLNDARHPRQVEAVRERLAGNGIPYVIENVPGAPLISPVILCGSHFGLTSVWPGVGLPGAETGTVRVGLFRHRGFEAHGFTLPDPGAHDHGYRAVPVYGYTNNFIYRGLGFGGETFSDLRRRVMDIGWMEHEELNEAIPPAYTAYVGQHLMGSLERQAALGAHWSAIMVCAWCARSFWTERKTARYCSGGCRQAAYRVRQRPGGRQRARDSTSRVITETPGIRQCAWCAGWFRPRRATGKYCSGGCRQAAFRARAALR